MLITLKRNFRIRPARAGRQAGFTLVELMVAITLSLLLLAALSQAFVYNSRDRREIESTSRQIEAGRYALRVISDSLQHAGFLGEFNINVARLTAIPVALPGAKPDACATSLANITAAMPLHIQGYDNSNGGLGCIADVRAGTDVVVVRHTSTCIRGSTDCNDLAGAPYFQASLCNNDLDSPNASNFFRLNTNTASPPLDRTLRDCATVAPARRYLTHIYFVANNDQAGDGIPTLKRAELADGQFVIQSIANGVENLQAEYGIDVDDDGQADAFTANPDTFNGCAGAAAACSPENWWDVVAVKLHVLARNPEFTSGHQDSKTYTLGRNAADAAQTVGPFNDAFKRHVYQNSVILINPAQRRWI